jgi:hypothetical protein
MRRDRSAYEILGIQPDADREEIDRSYRRLLKQFHPDRPGGDRAKTEQIIAAYRSLSMRPSASDEIAFDEQPAGAGKPPYWQIAGLCVAIALLLVALLAGPVDPDFASRLRAIDLSGKTADMADDRGAADFDSRVDATLVAEVSATARREYAALDEDALGDVSRACHRRFVRSPELSLLDSCVAYDLAIIRLQDRDPAADRGPFRESAIVRRHWADAAMLTRNVYAIDARLDRLRIMVELALAPTMSEPPVKSQPVVDFNQGLLELPNAVSVDELPSADSDQRNVSDAPNLSE